MDKVSQSDYTPTVSKVLDFRRPSTVIPQQPDKFKPKQMQSQQYKIGTDGKLEVITADKMMSDGGSSKDSVEDSMPALLKPDAETTSRKSKPEADTTSKKSKRSTLCYGQDLWDCSQVIEQSTMFRSETMKAIKKFMIQFKTSTDAYANSIAAASKQLRLQLMQFSQPGLIDTLMTSQTNFVQEMDHLAEAIKKKSEQGIQRELVDAVDVYQKHYLKTSEDLMKQSEQILQRMHMERTAMLFCKENYYHNMHSLVQLKKECNDDPKLLYQENHQKKVKHQQSKVDQFEREYRQAVEKCNVQIDLVNSQYRDCYNKIQSQDESQIKFVKFYLEKFNTIFDNIGKIIRDHADTVGDGADIITPETDIRIFIQHHQSSNPCIQREFFQAYTPPAVKSVKESKPVITENYMQEQWNNHQRARMSEESKDDFEIIPSDTTFQTDRELLNQQFRGLVFDSKPISIEQKGYIIQLMHSQEMRDIIVEILNEVSGTSKPIKSYECLKLVGDIIRFILTLSVHEQLQDCRLLYTVMDSAQYIYFVGAKKRKSYLYELLSDHGIWSDSSAWSDTIEFYISGKIDDATARKKRKEDSDKQNQPKNLKTLFSGKLLKGMLQTKEEKMREGVKDNQNLVFNELSRFVAFFISLNLPYQQANSILVSICDLFQLEKSRAHILCTELRSNQRNTDKMFTEVETRIWSLNKRSSRLCRFGYTDTTLILGCVVRFVDTDSTLKAILCCSHDMHEILQTEVLKQALLRSSPERIGVKRKQLWLKLLKIDSKYVQGEFKHFRQLSQANLSKTVADTIEVDIKRSFCNMKGIKPENLTRILNTYAIVNPALDYCQGMNFIAGFLYLMFGDEALSFAVMRQVIQNFELSLLFNTETPKLKLSFYQLDRLISIILPDLHSHLKDENVNSSFYSSSFFITIFTQCLQNQTKADTKWKLERVWDYFIVYGWKAIFKIALLILKSNEDALIGMPFEVMLSQINQMPTKYLIQENESNIAEHIKQFDREINQMRVPTILLERLKREFDDSNKQLGDQIKQKPGDSNTKKKK